MGTESFLRVGIDGTQAEAGERVVVRSLNAIMLGADNAATKFDNLDKRIGGCGRRSAPEAANIVKRSMDDIARSAEVAGVSVSTLENMFVRLAARTAMIAGIYQTIGGIKSAVVESLRYLSQIETAGLSISASFLAGGEYIDQTTRKALEGSQALKRAQIDSVGVIDQLKVANLKTSATLDQLIYAYQVTLPEAQAKAFNRQQVKDYTLAMVQAAGAIGLPYNQIAEETRDMLKGAVNSRNTRIATILGMGPQNAEYMAAVRKGGDELYNYLMGRLTAFKLAGEETQKTWAGLWSNVKDIAKIGGGEAVSPLFEAIKKELKEIQDSIVSIDKATGEMKINPEFEQKARDLGVILKSIFDGVVSGTRAIIDHAESIKLAIEMYLGYKAVIIASTLATAAMSTELGKSVVLASRVMQGKAMYLDSPTSNVARTKEGLEKASEALAAAQSQRDYARATQDAMRADKEMATVRAANLESMAAEAEADLRAKAARLETIAGRRMEREAIQELIKARMEESAVDSLPNNKKYGVFTRDAYLAGKDFKGLKQQQEDVAADLARIQRQEAVAMEEVADAAIRNETVTSKLTKAREIQTVTETRFVAAVDQTTVAQKAVTAAEEVAALASNKHNAALTASTIGARALATAGSILETTMKGLGVAINFAFGTIEGLIVVVGSLYWALYRLYHLQETRNASLATIGAGSELSALVQREKQAKEELQKLQEEKMSPEDKKMTEMERFNKKLLDYRKDEKELIAWISEHQNDVFKGWRDSETGLYEIDRKRAQLRNVQDFIRYGRQQLTDTLAAEAERDASSKYQAQPPKTPTDNRAAMELAQAQKAVTDAWLTYDKAFTDRQMEAQKNHTKLLLEEITNQHNLQLMSEQQFINLKTSLTVKGIDSELNALKNRKSKILGELKNYGVSEESALDPNNERNKPGFTFLDPTDKNNRYLNTAQLTRIKAELDLRTKLQEELKKEGQLDTERAAALEAGTFNSLKNVRDLTRAYADLTGAILAVKGAQVESVEAVEQNRQSDLNKRLAAVQGQAVSSVMKGEPVDQLLGSLLEIGNIQAEIEQSELRITVAKYEQLKTQTEMKAQLLEQLGLVSQAEILRQSIIPMDPARLGIDATTKALKDLNNSLTAIVKKFEELHRNDTIKFQIEDMGVDQFTKRERDIQREYNKTKEVKEGLLHEYQKDEVANSEKIKALQSDLNLNDQLKTAQTTQLKKDMVMSYGGVAADLMGQLANTMDITNESQFKAAKALSIAQIVVSTGVAIMRAYADLGPIAGSAAAAAIATIGAMQLAHVAATTYKGGGSVGGVSAGFSGGGGFAGEANTGQVGGGDVGSKMGGPLETTSSRLTIEALQRIANSSENASIALTKVSDTMTILADLFKSGTAGGLIAGTLTAPPLPAGGHGSAALTGAIYGSIIPGLGTTIGAFIGGIMDGFFGGGWHTSSAGISLGLSQGTLSALDYEKQDKRGGWFHSDKTRYNYSTMDPKLYDAFDQNLSSIIATVNKTAAILGTSANIGSVSLPNTLIQTSGATEEQITKQLTDWFTKAADVLGQSVQGLRDYAYYGESAYDALIRMTTALQQVNSGLALTNHSLISSTLAGGDIASRIASAAGGVDKLAKLQNDYFTKMYTKAEQAQLTQAQAQREVAAGIAEINAAYTGLNWTVPTTVEQFRALVDGLNLNTDQGAALYISLMNLAPEMYDAANAMNDLQESIKSFMDDLQERQYQAMGMGYTAKLYRLQADQAKELETAQKNGYDVEKLKYVQSLEYANAIADVFKQAAQDSIAIKTSLLSGLTSMIQSTLAPWDVYDQKRKTYESTKSLAEQGDVTALKDLAGKAQDFLQASENYNSSNVAYQADKQGVIETLSKLAGLDTTSPTLEMAQQQLQTLQSLDQALNDGNKAQVAYLAGLLTNTGIMANYLQGFLNNSNSAGQTAAQAITSLNLPSFAVGSSGLPSDMAINAHKGEIIVDPMSSGILQRYGIQVTVADSYHQERATEVMEIGVRVMQAGFNRLIEIGEQQAADIAEIKRKIRQK